MLRVASIVFGGVARGVDVRTGDRVLLGVRPMPSDLYGVLVREMLSGGDGDFETRGERVDPPETPTNAPSQREIPWYFDSTNIVKYGRSDGQRCGRSSPRIQTVKSSSASWKAVGEMPGSEPFSEIELRPDSEKAESPSLMRRSGRKMSVKA
jgi:hypothetical protein